MGGRWGEDHRRTLVGCTAAKRRTEMVALLGQRLYEAGTRHDAATLVPLYLRPTEAELKFGRKT